MTKRRAKPHGPPPQRPNSRTPRKGRNDPSNQKAILVAEHERLDRRIRERMRSLPTKQEPNSPKEHPTVSHRPAPKSEPIRRSSNGSNHPTPQEWSLQRHTNHSRPRMHESSPLPPLCNHHHGRRHRQTIPPQCLSVVRNPQKDNHRPRPPIYLTFRHGPVSKAEDQAEHINGLPPTN
jgi:hypothetical protein